MRRIPKPKAGAPKSQTKPATPNNPSEKKTARPSKKAKLDTPVVPFTPKSPQAKGKMKEMK